MKKYSFKFAFLFILFTLFSFVPAEDHRFISKEGKYSVDFPASYTTDTKDLDGTPLVQAQAFLNEQLFFVAHTVHTTEITDNKALAKGSLDGFAGSIGGKVTRVSTWKVNNQKGVQAKIAVKEKKLKVEYKVILIGQIQYQLAVLSDPKLWNQSAANQFFQSFKVKE